MGALRSLHARSATNHPCAERGSEYHSKRKSGFSIKALQVLNQWGIVVGGLRLGERSAVTNLDEVVFGSRSSRRQRSAALRNERRILATGGASAGLRCLHRDYSGGGRHDSPPTLQKEFHPNFSVAPFASALEQKADKSRMSDGLRVQDARDKLSPLDESTGDRSATGPTSVAGGTLSLDSTGTSDDVRPLSWYLLASGCRQNGMCRILNRRFLRSWLMHNVLWAPLLLLPRGGPV